MSDKELAIQQIDTLPDNVVKKVLEFILFQKFTMDLFQGDTDYLESVPGMVDIIKEGMNTPLSECVSHSEVWSNV